MECRYFVELYGSLTPGAVSGCSVSHITRHGAAGMIYCSYYFVYPITVSAVSGLILSLSLLPTLREGRRWLYLHFEEGKKRKKGMDGRGSIPRPAVYESIALTTVILTLAGVAAKRRRDKANNGTGEIGRAEVSVELLFFSVTALIRKWSVGQKACESLAGIRMKFYVKYEGDACRYASVIPLHTDTDRQANVSLYIR